MGHIYKLTVQKESTAVIISSQGSEKASVLVLTPGVSLHSCKKLIGGPETRSNKIIKTKFDRITNDQNDTRSNNR